MVTLPPADCGDGEGVHEQGIEVFRGIAISAISIAVVVIH
jgi:hypothetical protein